MITAAGMSTTGRSMRCGVTRPPAMAAVISAAVVTPPVVSAPVITTTPPAAYNGRPVTAAPTVSIAVGVIAVAGVVTVIARRGGATVVDIACITAALYIAITRGDVTTGKRTRE